MAISLYPDVPWILSRSFSDSAYHQDFQGPLNPPLCCSGRLKEE